MVVEILKRRPGRFELLINSVATAIAVRSTSSGCDKS